METSSDIERTVPKPREVTGMDESPQLIRARKEWHEALGSLEALREILRSKSGPVTPNMREELSRRQREELEKREALDDILAVRKAWEKAWHSS